MIASAVVDDTAHAALRPEAIVTAYAAEETGSIAAAAAAATEVATLTPDEYRAQGDIADGRRGRRRGHPLPAPAPIARIPVDDTYAADIVEAAERLAAIPTMSGWKIQLAAAPTQAAALSILQKAQSAGGAMVADAARLYRAGVEGFGNPLSAPASPASPASPKPRPPAPSSSSRSSLATPSRSSFRAGMNCLRGPSL